MVAFGSEQGLSDFETDGATVIVTTGIACYFKDSAKASLRAKI